MEARFATLRRARKRLLHRRHIAHAKLHRLEIGERPPRLAQPGIERDRAAIGSDAVGQPPDRLEHMAISHPHQRLIGPPRQHILVDRLCCLELAEPVEHGGAQIGIALALHVEPLQLVQRFGGAIGPVEDGREIDARGVELRRQFQRPAQQRLGVARPVHPRGQLGQHANCRHVEGLGLEVALEDRFGVVKPVLAQRERGDEQLRIARRCGHLVAEVVGLHGPGLGGDVSLFQTGAVYDETIASCGRLYTISPLLAGWVFCACAASWGRAMLEAEQTKIITTVRNAQLAVDGRIHCLEFVDGFEVERRHLVGPMGLRIGRTPPADIVIADSEVSRNHCFVAIKDGDLYVSDLNSTNGTFVDRERVSGVTALPVGSILQVGRRTLKHEWRTKGEIDQAEEFDRELQRAASYVQALLPPPSREGAIRADWCYQPCARLGGDAFGYGQLTEHLYVGYLIDVSGHGASAAMHAVSVMNQLRQRSLPGVDMAQPAQVLSALNKIYQMDDHAGMYFTMW